MTVFPSPTDHGWLSVHVFYASNANPMLVEGVRPLVDELREEGLISRYFFIKYWMEGPHVRLRVLPAPGVDPALVRARVDEALAAFLRRRPALYEVDADGLGGLYKQMFLAEYGQERWDVEYGPDGVMPMRANNSAHHIAYEREYSRYGGPAGIELAEWHFEHSSDVVLDLLATTNVHVRPVLLGLSTQLTTMMCAAFLDDDRRIADFLDEYRRFWEVSYQEPSDDYHASFDSSYRKMDAALRERLAGIRAAARDTGVSVTGIEGRWLAHCRELRDRVLAAADRGDLVFQRGGGEPTVVRDRDAAMSILLSSYVHMTNNRLGVSILDEIYLSYLIRTALLDDMAPGDPAETTDDLAPAGA
ncbi:thiopeptide-type bacteriocin biosynthesis domain-containing protein [Micromonospora pallida]|uniref:Thiopeptide-type bacteriocin biosynthesis domain-containing protein n=1 Tax=Micromonospora pallida TaxID=145854 RepID=A0A1C6RQT3_9ACTN|nr:thiopeptide-type bacteriocin biosynthesis protein [Micromonospora pallida]SCL19396.1 thiopeptide-type bacteriocin biosynthesis domain-containing protein [Micromonospora pallida]